MQVRNLFADDDAVSPVIGVILMVAITVILAAVIGTFVLGLGDQVQTTSPSASFTFGFTDEDAGTSDVLEITHDGGDSIESDRLSIAVTGATAADGAGDSYDVDVAGNNETWTDIAGSSTTVGAGNSITVGSGSFNETGTNNQLPGHYGSDAGATPEEVDLEGAVVRFIWTNENEDTSATLGTWDGPES